MNKTKGCLIANFATVPFIALWPRPGIFLPRKRPEDGVIVYARTAAAAGIKVEAE
ncbi:hypothetical protein [Klebsiella pneumoniae]|uniref:hypothetical protein n=1 Tax=Klebsiella pneumoniae TaxID=573 RepID=UPI001D18693B|nr:hypothetical protein [Klebsiella pneumoniae]